MSAKEPTVRRKSSSCAVWVPFEGTKVEQEWFPSGSSAQMDSVLYGLFVSNI